MRALILILVATLAAAETPEAPPPETVTLTRAQILQLENDLEAMVRQREQEAYKRGQFDVRQRCASLI